MVRVLSLCKIKIYHVSFPVHHIRNIQSKKYLYTCNFWVYMYKCIAILYIVACYLFDLNASMLVSATDFFAFSGKDFLFLFDMYYSSKRGGWRGKQEDKKLYIRGCFFSFFF